LEFRNAGVAVVLVGSSAWENLSLFSDPILHIFVDKSEKKQGKK
jgi:predicted aminopeptidase